MSDMKPIRRKGAMLEKADGRFDFGSQLRRLEPGAVGDGPVLEARPVKRTPAPRAGQAVVTAPVITHEVAPESSPAPAGAAVAEAYPAAASGPASTPPAVTKSGTGVARRRFETRVPVQPIDRTWLHNLGMVEGASSSTPLAEEYRLIKRQILRNAAGNPAGRRIIVTSAQPAEGKTFSAINLALSLANEHGLSVLLVDADSARNEAVSRLGIVPGKGLLDILADASVDPADCVIPTDIPELSVLPAGQATLRDTELFNSARMIDLLATLEADAPDRIILFDSMPLLAASSAGVIAQLCGQVLVVVRADVTREAVLRDAIGLIGQHHGISLLLNRVRFTPEGRRFGSYYGEGG